MEIVFGAVSGLVVEVGKCMFSPIYRHVSYFFNHEKKAKILKEQLEKLQDRRERVKESASSATRNGDLIFSDVDKWLGQVDKKIAGEEVENLRKDEEKANKRCFIGLCPNFNSRYHLSKKAEAETTAIAELLREAEGFVSECVSHGPDPQQAVAEIVEASVKCFEAFRSRENVLQGILEALKDPNVQRVGVYGMGGVGKTMLVKEVAMEARKQNLFDAVAIATISNSKQTDIKNVQAQIAEALGMNLKGESESGRARELRQLLKNARGVLIILDDVWVTFKLEDIGILLEDDQKIATERHKLLLTSRDGILLSNVMKVERNFEVRVLSQEEGMVLFAKIVGEKWEALGYELIAADVVKRCEGLPVAISAIANALKPLDLDGWKDALRQIQRSNPTNLEGIKEGVYLSLELSYNHLTSDEARRIFLLCGLMPQGSDIDVSDLIKYSWGLGFLGGVRTLDEARRCVTSLVNKLKSSSLLLGSENKGLRNDEYVKVHDIVRDVSISIASENEHMFFVDDEAHVEELLKKRKLKKCTALSLLYSDIREVPLHVSESAELELLLFFNKHESLEVPDAVIKENNKLKVLDWSGMDFPSLPSSFCFLTNLRTLCLKHCRLRDISIIGKLKKLEILSLGGYGIEELPEELAQLSELKLLDLKYCSNIKVIPANVISQLCRLEELYVGYSFNKWDAKGNASLAELKHLDRLIALDICIPKVPKMPENLFSEKLERYNITVGEVSVSDYRYYSLGSILKLSGIHHLDHNIEMLLKKTENLYLKNVELYVSNFICPSKLTSLVIYQCNNMRNLFTSSMARSLVQLKLLDVKDCESMIEIIAKDEEEIVDATNFKLPSLALLNLFQLPKLKSFSCKTVIECPSLTTMGVMCCDQMKLLFANSNEVNYQIGEQEEREAALFWVNKATFPCLERLYLSFNKNLKEIWKGELMSQCFPNLKDLTCREEAVNLHVKHMSLFPSLEKLEINFGFVEEILQGEGLEFILSSVPKLTELRLSDLHKLLRLWDEKCEPCGSFFLKLMTLEVLYCRKLKKLVPSSKSFPNLVTMRINNCESLLNLLTHSVAKSFVQLKTMSISYCTKIEGIIGEDEAEDSIIFEQLKYLELNDLPSLECFCLTKCSFEFPSLDQLIVVSCHKLKIFCHGALSTPKLQSLQLSEERDGAHWAVNDGDLNNAIQEIFQKKIAVLNSGRRRSNWDFVKFPELVELLNSSNPQMTSIFKNIKYIRVHNCKSTSLGHLFTPSMVMCLVNLDELEVKDCPMIEQVIAKEDQVATCKIILPQLRVIRLNGCFSLTSFCVGGYSFECPEWTSLAVKNCPNMVSFLKEQEKEAMAEAFFSNKVNFSNLSTLILTSINIQTIWSGALPTMPKLSTLRIQDCENMKAVVMTIEESIENLIFPILSWLTLQSLPKFRSFCSIIDSDTPSLFDQRVLFPHLQSMKITHLNNVKILWNNQISADSFCMLKRLEVKRCWNLKALFPLSVARGLVGLNELDISFCGVEEIVLEEQGSQEINNVRFEFPELTKVELYKLPKLKSFYPGMCTIISPKLKILDSFRCNKLKMFAAKQLISQQEIDDEKGPLGYQNTLLSLFSFEEVIPKLQELSLSSDDIEMIENCMFPTSLFDEVETLHVQCYHDQSQVLQFSFLHRVQSLEKLVVRSGKFKDLFPCVGVIKEENYGGPLPRIKHLQLNKPDLGHIQNQNIELHSPIIEGLETLEVFHCDTTFPSLAPLIASFSNLTKLDVWNCNGMEKLLATSTCQNLVQLKTMSIRECYMVTEIVAKEAEDEGTCDITFSKLSYLELNCLPSLTNFYSGNYTLKFLSLKDVILKHCPGLKIFSKRVYTPELHNVREGVRNCEFHWAGDLNSTIQQLYAEKGGYQFLNYLDFSKFPELMDISNKNLQETLDFKILESLQICNYNSSGYLFTRSMASLLQKLCTLKVQNCTTIEHVIAEKEFDGSQKVNDGILLPLLESMLVESCPRLISFFLLEKDTFESTCLNEITIIDCPKMIAFVSAFSRGQNKDTTQESNKDDVYYGSFFTEKVLLPSLVHLKLSSTNIQKIWEDSKLPTISSGIQHLTELIVKSCCNLRYLFPSSLVKSCAQLETLEICDCKLINVVVFTNDSAEEERIAGSGVQFEFPYLRMLVIENCPSLETFISKSLTRNETVTSLCILCDEKVALDNLKTLKLRKIAAKAVWRRQFLTPQCLLQLRRISITDCDKMKEIVTCVSDEVSRDAIVFYQLKYLELGILPNLESFCSQECTLEFPSLKEVSVKVCPNMKTFSRGETSTPKLQKLQLTEGEDEELCEGGLNTTIQKFFAKDEHL